MSESPFNYGQLTDTGMLRGINEDSALSRCYTDESAEIGLFIVADGLGGHPDGEKASKLALETIETEFPQAMKLDNLTDALRNCIRAANRAIIAQLPGSGTAVTAVAIDQRTAYIGHVGDTRAYLVTEQEFKQLTVDHTLVQHLLDSRRITQDQADMHPQGHVLLRALGQEETLDVDTYIFELPAAGHLLLCSDGLWNMVDQGKMQEIILRDEPQEACTKLIALANFKGGSDNITAIVVKID